MATRKKAAKKQAKATRAPKVKGKKVQVKAKTKASQRQKVKRKPATKTKVKARTAVKSKVKAKARAKAKSPTTPTPNYLAGNEFAPLSPYLAVNGARAALEFYQAAFGAKVGMVMDAEDKTRLMHAQVIINGGEVMLSDTFPEFGDASVKAPGGAHTTTVSIHLQVDNADKWWQRAVAAGAEVVMPLEDQFWGDRFGRVRDPFGHVWSIASTIQKP